MEIAAMDEIIAWCHEYWWLVLIAVVTVIKILNVVTKHFSEHRGVVRWCLFVIDLLDILKSSPPPRVPK